MILKGLILLTLLGPSSPGIAAEGIERQAFTDLVRAVCDHEKMAAAFVPSDWHGRSVLHVEFPRGIIGVGPEETIEIDTRHGLVVLAYKKYIFFFQIARWLEFKDIVEAEQRVHAYFRTYSHIDATVPIPIIKGSVEWKLKKGTMDVRFLNKIPSDKAFKQKR